jgi:hypothetical protein
VVDGVWWSGGCAALAGGKEADGVRANEQPARCAREENDVRDEEGVTYGAVRPAGPLHERRVRGMPWRAARGSLAGPSACRGAAHGIQMGGGPTPSPWSTAKPPRPSVRRSIARTTRGRRIQHARALQSAGSTSPSSIFNPFSPFRNCKTPKIVN